MSNAHIDGPLLATESAVFRAKHLRSRVSGMRRKGESDSTTDLSACTSLFHYGRSSLLDDKDDSLQKQKVKLEDQITNERLCRLQKIFEEAGHQGSDSLAMEEFASAMRQSMGVGVSDHELEQLFMKVDTNCDGGVDWDEYLSYMLLEYREKDLMTAMQYEKPLPQTVRPVSSPHRDLISRVAFMPVLRNRQGYRIEKMDFAHGRYISVSKDGVVNFWNNEMQHIKVTQMESKKGNIISNWVTDLVVMPNVNMVAISSTDGCISFYDVTANKFERHLTIWGLEQAPLTMDYSFDESNINYAVLLWGDAGGNVSSCSFSQCLCGGPFGPPSQIKGNQRRISFASLLQGNVPSVRAFILRKLHFDWVISVRYIQSTGLFVSCCQDSDTAMYIGDLEARKITSYFKLRKGVLCFDFCKTLNIIATGGLDHLIRVWNPYVTAKAILVLKGHNKAIVHLIVHQQKELILSMAKDNAIRVFDLKDQTCVQHIPGKMTPIGNASTINCIHFNPKSENLVLATSHLCIYERQATEVVIQQTSHDAPITAALYNPLFDVIVSACHDSVVSVWSVTSGEMIIQFRKAHKRIVDCSEQAIEITAMTFDHTYRRLITGAQDGSVKIWNFNNGALLSELYKVDNREITGLVAPATRILVSGWNRRVVSHIDVLDVDDVPTFWPIKHTDDIMCMDFYPPSIVATCSYGADIIIWYMETGHMACRMNINEGVEPLRMVQQSFRQGNGYRDRLKSMQNSTEFGSSTRKSPVLALTLKTTNMHNPELLTETTLDISAAPSASSCRTCGGVPKTDTSMTSTVGEKTTLDLPPLSPRGCSCTSSNTLALPVDPSRIRSQSDTTDKLTNKKRMKAVLSPKSYRQRLRERASQGKKRLPNDVGKPARRMMAPAVYCDNDVDLGEILSIDKILFLKSRPIAKDTATLIAGGAEGWVQAWSIHHQGIMMGQFSASKNAGESISALATDEKNYWLFTGDTQGYIRVWDISTYCVAQEPGDARRIRREVKRLYRKFQHLTICADAYEILQPDKVNHAVPPASSNPKKTLNMPPLLSSWRGHLQCVASIDFIPNRELIVSSGLDGIVRLWHFTGRYIGTYGEHKLWNYEEKSRPYHIKPVIPTELRPVLSGCSIRCITGRIHKQWRRSFHIILFIVKTLRSLRERGIIITLKYDDSNEDEAASPSRVEVSPGLSPGPLLQPGTLPPPSVEQKGSVATKLAPIDIDAIMKKEIKSEILGKSYKKLRRHRPLPLLPKVKHFHNQAIVFSSIPFTDLNPVKEYIPSPFVQELVNRSQAVAQLQASESKVRFKRSKGVKWLSAGQRLKAGSQVSRASRMSRLSRGPSPNARETSPTTSRPGSRATSPRDSVRSGTPTDSRGSLTRRKTRGSTRSTSSRSSSSSKKQSRS